MNLRGRSLPIAVLASAFAAAIGLLVTVTTLVLFEVTGDGHGLLAAGAGGLIVTAVGAGMAALLGGWFAGQLGALRRAAVRRLENGGRSGFEPPGDSPLAEIADLARTLDAITLRSSVADDLVERHRLTAEQASVGMFELLSGLVAAEESARGQLAAELHDTVAQSVALARMELTVGDPEAIRRATDYVDEAEEQVRAVMARTRPPALREGDLAAAVTSLCEEFGVRYGLEVSIEWPTSPHPLSMVAAVTVYRFFQEALLNVVKHAEVDRCSAALDIDERGVLATVRDDGSGFALASVVPELGRHVGIGLLRERARLTGGSLDVISAPGEGTVLSLRLPHPPGSRVTVATRTAQV